MFRKASNLFPLLSCLVTTVRALTQTTFNWIRTYRLVTRGHAFTGDCTTWVPHWNVLHLNFLSRCLDRRYYSWPLRMPWRIFSELRLFLASVLLYGRLTETSTFLDSRSMKEFSLRAFSWHAFAQYTQNWISSGTLLRDFVRNEQLSPNSRIISVPINAAFKLNWVCLEFLFLSAQLPRFIIMVH